MSKQSQEVVDLFENVCELIESVRGSQERFEKRFEQFQKELTAQLNRIDDNNKVTAAEAKYDITFLAKEYGQLKLEMSRLNQA
ncbi:hypothetical protein PC41400_07955 [Paenibacillus chitinolyticus]|uniref:Uncharacterized protein n=1 Tax=Paenibacillus chitinolyticus TaxID=79263 RepID=A0A410WTC8_9BACL|nr:hypothetical protein [Paenibacillus chitinolyticus]MCY9588643.1 hypothetical protein [Paenibacillus chitinolyticus]MCY9595853.1 hypothetical protein [Paenibacillus chitinolyticus]QAV17600.1 hypothetical protein PC41400_07955 [Paenibacillus chitinolyticus]